MKWFLWKFFSKKKWVCPLCGKIEKITWLKVVERHNRGTPLVHVCTE